MQKQLRLKLADTLRSELERLQLNREATAEQIEEKMAEHSTQWLEAPEQLRKRVLRRFLRSRSRP